MIRRIHVPLNSPEDVIPYLGAPHHWKEGRSAKSLIDQWWLANDVPPKVRCLLDQANEWSSAELIDAFAERCTDLGDGRPTHSQSDLLCVLGLRTGVGILSIEAKVDEGFDKTVDEWRSDGSSGKARRLAGLCNCLGIADPDIGHLRYQLLHRTASALIEARRYRASNAMMVVQSWSDTADGFSDFVAFETALGVKPTRKGEISRAVNRGGVSLRLGWSAECD